MPLSGSELKALKADAKRKVVSARDSLFVVVESVRKGGGNSFIGRTRFPPGRQGKQVEVRIGPYGRGAGRDPRELKREQAGVNGEQGPSKTLQDPSRPFKTLQDAIDGFLVPGSWTANGL